MYNDRKYSKVKSFYMLKIKRGLLLCIIGFLGCTNSIGNNNIIHNGIPWFDDQGNIVNAHGACIVEDNGRYYLFGEYKSNGVNAFFGFSCYSSDDLCNWKFERLVLRVQPEGILGPNRIGERVKVMKCPTTGEFVMYMHCDDMKYMDPHIGYATCSTIDGEYTFHGPLLHDGEPIRRWDMGTFQDTDGEGYLLIHHGIIYRLSDDYRSAESKILSRLEGSGESPAMLKKNGTYYMLYSNLTSWERNDNYYYTASSIEGPWTKQGLFTPKGSLTYNSQCSFVFPITHNKDTVHMYMGDRWSFPNQSDAATQVWLPLQANGDKLFIPQYWEAWDPATVQQVNPLVGAKLIDFSLIRLSNIKDWGIENGQLSSNIENSYLETTFKGTRFIITGESTPSAGYAKVSILDNERKIIHASLVDFYSKVPNRDIRFMSPRLSHGNYIVRIEVTGIIPEWFKKNGDRLGSSNCYVTVNDLYYY